MEKEISDKQLLTLQEVLNIVRIGKSTLYTELKNGKFPQPIKIGERRVLWKASDIQAFIDNDGKIIEQKK